MTRRRLEMLRTVLTDQMWNRLKALLPPERGRWGRPAKNNRLILEGILWIHRTSAPWRDLPEAFGPWQTVYSRFRRWTQAGIWHQVLDVLKRVNDATMYMIDSTYIKAHQHAAGAKGGPRARRWVVPEAA